ncbi:MAG: hypothetical protein ABSG32_27150 [Terriglobia bacterium]|jgi:hypothetical protein
MRKRFVNLLHGGGLSEGVGGAFAVAFKYADGAAVEDNLDAPAIGFLAKHTPILRPKVRVVREQ